MLFTDLSMVTFDAPELGRTVEPVLEDGTRAADFEPGYIYLQRIPDGRGFEEIGFICLEYQGLVQKSVFNSEFIRPGDHVWGLEFGRRVKGRK